MPIQTHYRVHVLVLVLSLLTMFLLTNCARKGGDAGPTPDSPGTQRDLEKNPGGPRALPGTFTDVYSSVLSQACIECHVPNGAATVQYGVRLDFTTQATAYQTLLDSLVSGASSVGICGGVKIVAPGNPQSSYLAAVLISGYSTNNFGGVAGCVPYSAHLQDQNISSDEQNSIVSWIQNGAQNN